MLTIERALPDVGDGPERNREKSIISDIVSSKCCPYSEQKGCRLYSAGYIPTCIYTNNTKRTEITTIKSTVEYSLHQLLASYVVMVTVINWVPPPHSKKAPDAMEVVVVGMVTAATPQQEEHTPATDRV